MNFREQLFRKGNENVVREYPPEVSDRARKKWAESYGIAKGRVAQAQNAWKKGNNISLPDSYDVLFIREKVAYLNSLATETAVQDMDAEALKLRADLGKILEHRLSMGVLPHLPITRMAPHVQLSYAAQITAIAQTINDYYADIVRHDIQYVEGKFRADTVLPLNMMQQLKAGTIQTT